MTCWNCGQAADKHTAEAGGRPACPPDPGPSDTDLGLVRAAEGAITAAEDSLKMALGHMRRAGRGLVEAEHLEEARGHLTRATYSLRQVAG